MPATIHMQIQIMTLVKKGKLNNNQNTSHECFKQVKAWDTHEKGRAEYF